LRVDAVWKSPGVRRYLMDDARSGTAEVDWVTGAVLMARRSAIQTVGFLDERYFLYWEDLDWCYRMRQAGWRIYRVPEARAVHLQRREGVRRPFSRAGRSQFVGALRFFRKFGWNPGRVA
jgi:N-acetylglucosaminyl-diphospho-decaprenol L-rhamnosyltransferase